MRRYSRSKLAQKNSFTRIKVNRQISDLRSAHFPRLAGAHCSPAHGSRGSSERKKTGAAPGRSEEAGAAGRRRRRRPERPDGGGGGGRRGGTRRPGGGPRRRRQRWPAAVAPTGAEGGGGDRGEEARGRLGLAGARSGPPGPRRRRGGDATWRRATGCGRRRAAGRTRPARVGHVRRGGEGFRVSGRGRDPKFGGSYL